MTTSIKSDHAEHPKPAQEVEQGEAAHIAKRLTQARDAMLDGRIPRYGQILVAADAMEDAHALLSRLASSREAELEQADAWKQVGYWKEKADQADRRWQDFNNEHLPRYQKALTDKRELERRLAIAEEKFTEITAMLSPGSPVAMRRIAREALAKIRQPKGDQS